MGYELDKLLNRYGVSAPTIPYSGALTPEQKPALQAYKAEYQQRVNDTPAYMGMPGAHMGTQKIDPPSRPQTQENRQTIRDFFNQNPNLTQDQIKSKQQEFGVNNTDIHAATGNYWGNTLRPPSFQPAQPVKANVLPGDVGPPVPLGVSSNGPMGAPGYVPPGPAYVPAGPAIPELNSEQEPSDGSVWSWKTREARGYAGGGLVDEDEENKYGRGLDLSRVSPEQMAMLQRSDPQALQRGVARFAGASAQPATPKVNPMLELLEKYQKPSNNYAGELRAARESHSKESQAFQDMIKQAAEAQGDSGPSKSEMYFRLAAALGSPTKTGSFGETLGNAANTLGQYQSEVRQAQRSGAANKLQLALQGQQARMAASKDDLNTTRQLAAEEMKEQRAEQAKVMEAYFKSGQPQSEAGKIAIDAGFQPGTPEYTDYVKSYIKDKMDSGDLYKQAMLGIAQGNQQLATQRVDMEQKKFEVAKAEKAKLTPAEMKLKAETETAANTMAQAYRDLKEAERLNQDAYDGSFVDKAKYFVAGSVVGSEDPKTVNTGELLNILKRGTVATAAATLKTQISDSDIKLLGQIQGLDAKSKKERSEILANTKRIMAENYKATKKKLDDINAGKYRNVMPATPDGLEE